MVMKERSRAMTIVITNIAMLSCSRKENRFIRRLRIARAKTYKKREPDKPRFLEQMFTAETDVSDENDLPDENDRKDDKSAAE